MIAMRRGLIFAFKAVAIAIGAIKAVAAIFPGPRAEIKSVIKKKIIGKNCGLDLTNPTILFVNICSVPFSYAIPNIKVIPTNIKKRLAGKRSGISFSLRPRTNIPIA
jgi:hypothetical protein